MSFFTIKERIDKVVYRGFNVISDVVFFARPSIRKEISRNGRYRLVHNGQRCFIIGTGPSLNNIDPCLVDRIKDEIVFGVNSFYKIDAFSSVVPNYYVLVDNNYWGISSGTFDEVREKYAKSPVFVSDVRALKFLKCAGKDSNYLALYAKNYPVDFIRFDAESNLSITMNVVGVSIQVAIYMGFKEIYLLGCDYNSFCSVGGSHSYDDQDEKNTLPSYNLAFYLKYYAITTEFHYKLAKLARDNNVILVNATEGSLLDAYPYKSLESIVAGDFKS